MSAWTPASHFFTAPRQGREFLDALELGKAKVAMLEESSVRLGPWAKQQYDDDPRTWSPGMRHRWFIVVSRARHAQALAREWTEAEQDAEARALRNLSAPVPIVLPEHEWIDDPISVEAEHARRAMLHAADPELAADLPGFRHVDDL
jgi:hypothetical protein